jgi:hypothetical protein
MDPQYGFTRLGIDRDLSTVALHDDAPCDVEA